MQGKILAAKYARENNVPYLGICLGMQIAVIEFARSVLGLHGATSTEFDPETKTPCVVFMPEVYSLILLNQLIILFLWVPCLIGGMCFIDRVQRHIWAELCVLDQGQLTSKLLTANLQNCKNYDLDNLELIYYRLLKRKSTLFFWQKCHLWFLDRYGNVSSVDERHRHRYEVNWVFLYAET